MEMESFNFVNKQETHENQEIQKEINHENQGSQCQQQTERSENQDEDRGQCKNINDQSQDQKEIIENCFQQSDVLYFVGVNSIALNLLSNLYYLCGLEKLLIIIILNLTTYIVLYRQKQLLKYINNGQVIIKEFYIKSKKGLDKEKILIGFLIILITTLFVSNIYLQIQINKTTNNQFPIINHKLHYLQINTRHLQYQFEQINRMKDLKNDFIQQFYKQASIASSLNSKVKELQNEFNQKERIIQQLKKEVNELQTMEQNKQENANKQKLFQEEIIQKNYNINNQQHQHNQQKLNLQAQLKQQQNRFQKQFNQIIRDQNNQLNLYKKHFEEKLQKPIQQYRYIRPFHLSFQNKKEDTKYQQQLQKQATSSGSQQQNNQKFQQQNPQNQHQQQQEFKKEFKDSRLNFLNEQFRQLDSLLKQS
ncbi:hypothetical protein ABPG73_020106 [Tetrahymena malaccensis]